MMLHADALFMLNHGTQASGSPPPSGEEVMRLNVPMLTPPLAHYKYFASAIRSPLGFGGLGTIQRISVTLTLLALEQARRWLWNRDHLTHSSQSTGGLTYLGA